jgi:hypothetical protein
MQLHKSINNLFEMLEDSLVQLSEEQYTRKIDTLSGATIGQHVRHILEMFVCLQDGCNCGIVNYEKRKRDIIIENSKDIAIDLMHRIIYSLHCSNRELILEAGFDHNSSEFTRLPTNYFREIAYNLEHTIHHLALIRIGIVEVSEIQLPKEYGVASSTIKHRNAQAIN